MCPRCHQRLEGEVICWKVSENEIIKLHAYCYYFIESQLSHKPENKRQEFLKQMLKTLSAA